MAESTGGDILVQLLDGQRRIEQRMDGFERRMEAFETRLDRTNDTLTLLGSVIHDLTATVKGRIDDHERRITDLEGHRRS